MLLNSKCLLMFNMFVIHYMFIVKAECLTLLVGFINIWFVDGVPCSSHHFGGFLKMFQVLMDRGLIMELDQGSKLQNWGRRSGQRSSQCRAFNESMLSKSIPSGCSTNWVQSTPAEPAVFYK